MRARDNPLTVQRLQALRYRIDDADRSTLLSRLAGAGHRGAIVAPEGHGKTTLLRDLHEHYRGLGWDVRSVRLRRAQGRFTRQEQQALRDRSGPRVLLSVDGVDELSAVSRFRLRRWARAAGGLVVAAHREGFLPTVWHCRTSPELLTALLEQLGLAGAMSPEQIRALYGEHRGNLREVFFALYDEYARRPDPAASPAPVGVADPIRVSAAAAAAPNRSRSGSDRRSGPC